MRDLLSAVLPADARILEVGARSDALARLLARRGWKRYLGLTTTAAKRAAVGAAVEAAVAAARGADGDGPRPSFVPLTSSRQVRRNNAEVLILSGSAARFLWRYNRYDHARYVLWELRWNRGAILALGGTLKALLRRRVRLAGAGAVRLEAEPRRWFVALQVLRPTPPGEQRFVSPVLGVEGFFRRLRNEGVNYLVLRWFEELPHHEPGRDLDLLVADEHVGLVDAITDELPGLIQCDVYSVSGLPGTDYRETAHFPPTIARGMLERAVWWKEQFRVPCAEDHFLGLAYHALYHKGERSGIATSVAGIRPSATPSHDYAGILARMARSLGLKLELTMEGLDRHLASRGMRPPLDTLARFAAGNAWARECVRLAYSREREAYRGFCNFYIRDRAVALGYEDEIVARLREAGFVILHRIVLSDVARAVITDRVRGGNWGRGPFPRSGGGPAIVVVAFDPAPLDPHPRTRQRHPMVDDERIRWAKKEIREQLADRLPASERCSLLHSSDNGLEALECLRTIVPDDVPLLLARLERVRGSGSSAALEPAPVDATARGTRGGLPLVLDGASGERA